MEIPEVVSVRKFKEFNATQKEQLYETLLELSGVIEDIPKKSLRKILDVTLAVLSYKGQQLEECMSRHKHQSKADSSDDSYRSPRLLDENERLKIMLEKLEMEKLDAQSKIKQLTEEIFQLQRRLQEAAQSADGSDKDSSDPLSELDKQEELLRNINRKNKHIKRLLKEIESLQQQNIEQSKSLLHAEKELQQAKAQILQLSEDITTIDNERKSLKDTLNALQVEVSRLQSNITYLEAERENNEQELKGFIEKLEVKTKSWKELLDQKENEIKKLQQANKEHAAECGIAQKSTTTTSSSITTSPKTEDVHNEDISQDGECNRLLKAIEARDALIVQLESKVKAMAEEMLTTTQIMNQLSADQSNERNPQKPRACCKTIEESLRTTTERCQELSEMLERVEEDNMVKSEQAMLAIAQLDSYERGEDGLKKAIYKCLALEQRVMQRDRHIKKLVNELNSMNEIAQENKILRKRLNIDDDVVLLTTRNVTTKERNKDKIIDRLTLKLRASEEMRLQLKLERCDLKRELMQMQRQMSKSSSELPDGIESLHLTSEMGEVEDSLKTTVNTMDTQNLQHLESDETRRAIFIDSPNKYRELIEENETLRLGMYEILEKLRDYQASSDHITIDSDLLVRLMGKLHTPTPTQVPTRLHKELELLKRRESALRELLQQDSSLSASQQESFADDDNDDDDVEIPDLPSVESVRQDGELRNGDATAIELATLIDTSTRPTTPNRQFNATQLPVINDEQEALAAQTRELQAQLDELLGYKSHYETLNTQLQSSEDEIKMLCVELDAKVMRLEVDLKRITSSYAYMQTDYDRTLTAAKHNELSYIQRITELSNELCIQKSEFKRLQMELDNQRMATQFSDEDYRALLKTNNELQSQLACLVEQSMGEQQITDICTDYGIIRDNLQLDFVTAEEYERQQRDLKLAEERQIELKRNVTQLESLLEIAQNQIQSQQKLLNEITDNHINLRHLVADLQSTTEEKLLLAKIQRDLGNAKSEITQCKFEREQWQQRHELLKCELLKEQQHTAELKKSFHNERNNKDIKIKFLQKSLYVLKEKYAKFTPLIFLTNFVYAYKRFVKKCNEQLASTANGSTLPQEVIDYIENFAQTMVNNQGNDTNTSAQQVLIKLIKAETHCKMLEESQLSMQAKCESLQIELTELRLRYANEMEHWQTIAALFANDNNNSNESGSGRRGSESESGNGNSNNNDDTNHNSSGNGNGNNMETTTAPGHVNLKPNTGSTTAKDAATNTDTPVPAQRKTTGAAPVKRKSLELVDRMCSPFSSPHKTLPNGKKQFVETATQSEPAAHVPNNQLAVAVASSITTTDALVQTNAQTLEDQSVQTLDTDGTATCTDLLTLQKELQMTVQRANDHELMLQQTQQALDDANMRIIELKAQLMQTRDSVESNSQAASDARDADRQIFNQKSSGIIEKTILSFHTLLSEKDKSINKYQDLLQTERNQSEATIKQLNAEADQLRSSINNLNITLQAKDMEILELKTQLETVSVRRNSNEKLHLATSDAGDVEDNGGDNSLNELTDEKIEEMFQQEAKATPATAAALHIVSDNDNLEKQDIEQLKEVPTLLKQIKELKDKCTYLEKTLKTKEEELNLTKEKLQLQEEREKSVDGSSNPEIEQLRILLEEKDKHINDLMDTLNNFHDDQQRYIADSSNYSADQISKLAADLTRTEATNKIYQTQVEALRRQLATLTQREKQARELNQSLRNQLIKRPVVSIKTELNARVKHENLQKRMQQLELDLDDARSQIQRQQTMLETKRARSASEVGLWEKQKRWQQSAEKFKAKLEETESALEKTRTLLQSARNNIARLEKDKQVLEAKLGRAATHHHATSAHNLKCCRTPSCPNLHPAVNGACHNSVAKYTPSESPETYTGASSECSSPARSAMGQTQPQQTHYFADNHSDLIEALKARIELQQRKIIAMELEGKGTNALTTEMEKLQERYSAVEAQNIRLEAKNLQLQLDNDLLRQGDATDRLQKRIKHLEDYIIALKEEMAHTDARRELCKCSSMKTNATTQQIQSAEQTILSLRRIVEKLRAENKYLKDGRRSCESRSSTDTTTQTASPTELGKLQKLYAESLDKITALQIELNIKSKCPQCSNRAKASDGQVSDELCYVKEQLIRKTQLLQKAKVLLTRAAAKEKVLKEQLSLWKRKCSELQNVPVIDEISE